MALNASGPISLAGSTAGQSIAVELGLGATSQISLNDAAVRGLAGVPSGAITMPTNFYGKANQFSLVFSSDTQNVNLRSVAVSNGWDEASKVVATINNSVVISSNSTGTPALTISGSFPGGVDLINNGFIVGMGGAGGASPTAANASPGSSGGLALSVSTAVTLTNGSGVIAGGGGGGGGGSATVNTMYSTAAPGGGGGGGRTGRTNSAGGAGGAPGSPGTFSSLGAGGPPTANPFAGAGGNGGEWGSAGTGGQQLSGEAYRNAGGGGAAGAAISGNANITYVSTGTRLGALT
jgi:hypothetical protein